jgi:hypothetical protein
VHNAGLSSPVDGLHDLREASPLQIEKAIHSFSVVGDGDVLNLWHADTVRQHQP